VHGDGYYSIRTKTDLDHLEGALKVLAFDLTTGQMTDVDTLVLRSEPLFTILSTHPSKERSYLVGIPGFYTWAKQGRLIDHLNFAYSRASHLPGTNITVWNVVIWSNGPNGRNDNRRIDDVTGREFAVELPNYLLR
jgi:hypothetical protein